MTRGFQFGGVSVKAGQTRDILLPVSERYTGDPIHLPVRVIRGRRPGPKLFVTAAVHGEELNGTGVVHDLMYGQPPRVKRGVLALLPVVNIFGFETQSRYMPDRRDLNRSFPGSATGSLTSRVAHRVFSELSRFDFGVDLHTAATFRTNFPNVRGDLAVPGVRRLAQAFGCELMVHGKGPEGSFRRECVRVGCSVITVEAGEPFKIEPSVLEVGLRGVRNVLAELGMTDDRPAPPPFQTRVDKSTWVRASVGGILRFHVAPGDAVTQGQPVATNASVFGEDQNVLLAPVSGIVLGMTTLPCVKPGEPVMHLAVVPARALKAMRKSRHANVRGLEAQVRRDLATNVSIADLESQPASPASDQPA